MENKNISNYSELVLRINDLKWETKIKEEKLKTSVSELAYLANPISIIKESLHELAEDENTQTDLGIVSIRAGVSFITNKLFGKDNDIKDLISALLIEYIPSSVINDKIAMIANTVKGFLFPEKELETEEDEE